jgi:hypothetical protein
MSGDWDFDDDEWESSAGGGDRPGYQAGEDEDEWEGTGAEPAVGQGAVAPSANDQLDEAARAMELLKRFDMDRDGGLNLPEMRALVRCPSIAASFRAALRGCVSAGDDHVPIRAMGRLRVGYLLYGLRCSRGDMAAAALGGIFTGNAGWRRRRRLRPRSRASDNRGLARWHPASLAAAAAVRYGGRGATAGFVHIAAGASAAASARAGSGAHACARGPA